MKSIIRRLSEVEKDRSICGYRQCLLTGEDKVPASVSLVAISDAEPHYHTKTTEYYYVLEGRGELHLGEEIVALAPGTLVLIPPGLPHWAQGEVKVLVIGMPPFDPDDQHRPEESPS